MRIRKIDHLDRCSDNGPSVYRIRSLPAESSNLMGEQLSMNSELEELSGSKVGRVIIGCAIHKRQVVLSGHFPVGIRQCRLSA